MSNDDKPVFAVVELMGHVRIAGRLTEEERFGAKVGRLDIPQEDGSFVTQLFGGGSVYRITFVTEEVARHVAKSTSPAPVSSWDFPKRLAAAPTVGGDEYDSHNRVMDCGHTPEDCDCDPEEEGEDDR